MASFFDIVAPLYGKSRPGAVRVARLLSDTVRFTPADTVLDVGGGAGNIAQLLAPLVGHIAVVDTSAAMVAEAHKKGVAAVVGFVEHLPFANASVDKVLVVDALHHLPVPAAAVREIYRVLRPGGVALVVEYNPNTWWGASISAFEWVLRMGSRFYEPLMLSALFATEGFATRLPSNKNAQYLLVATK